LVLGVVLLLHYAASYDRVWRLMRNDDWRGPGHLTGK
jgi:hypothetical protein